MNLLDEINKISASTDERCQKLREKGSPTWDRTHAKEDGINRIIGVIAAFEVPNTKEDIVEFLSAAVPKARLFKKNILTFSQVEPLCWGVGIGLAIIGYLLFHWIGALVGGGLGYIASLFLQKYSYNPDSVEFKEAQAWRDKFDEVIIKGRSLRGDPEFTRQLDYYENLLNSK